VLGSINLQAVEDLSFGERREMGGLRLGLPDCAGEDGVTGEEDLPAASVEAVVAGFDANVGERDPGRSHLACEEAIPNKTIEFELVGIE